MEKNKENFNQQVVSFNSSNQNYIPQYRTQVFFKTFCQAEDLPAAIHG